MKCQVTSDTTRTMMISREVKVASYKEICGGEKIMVHLGYNNDEYFMKVENNELLPSLGRYQKGRFREQSGLISSKKIHFFILEEK